MNTTSKKKHWMGSVRATDDFDQPITNAFYDGKTVMGPWAMMSPASWKKYGLNQTGTGYAQKYEKQPDGKWLKTEG